MKIRCLHGFFIFEEMKLGELSDFVSRFGLELDAKDTYFTFSQLKDAPDYSIAGNSYLGFEALATFEGKPWEVMRENGLVYNFNTGELVPIASISHTMEIKASGRHYVSNGLILPGSITDDGVRVTDYTAWYSRDTLQFRYSEVLVE